MIRTACLVLLIATFASAGVLPSKVDVKVDPVVNVGLINKGTDFGQKLLKREANPIGVSANVFVGPGVPYYNEYNNGYHDTVYVRRGTPVYNRGTGVNVGVGVPFVGANIGVGVFGK